MQILTVSMKIAKCQKALLNYEESLIILKTCFKNVKKKAEKNPELVGEFLTVGNEYISILILLNKLQEAHDVVRDEAARGRGAGRDRLDAAKVADL